MRISNYLYQKLHQIKLVLFLYKTQFFTNKIKTSSIFPINQKKERVGVSLLTP